MLAFRSSMKWNSLARLTYARAGIGGWHRALSTNEHVLSFTSLPTAANEKDKPLREDVKDLGKILGDSIRQDDSQVFNSVEKLRQLGRKVIPLFFVFDIFLTCAALVESSST